MQLFKEREWRFFFWLKFQRICLSGPVGNQLKLSHACVCFKMCGTNTIIQSRLLISHGTKLPPFRKRYFTCIFVSCDWSIVMIHVSVYCRGELIVFGKLTPHRNMIATPSLFKLNSNLWLLYFHSCKFDIRHFPFDEQECRFQMGSWTYNGFVVTS